MRSNNNICDHKAVLAGSPRLLSGVQIEKVNYHNTTLWEKGAKDMETCRKNSKSSCAEPTAVASHIKLCESPPRIWPLHALYDDCSDPPPHQEPRGFNCWAVIELKPRSAWLISIKSRLSATLGQQKQAPNPALTSFDLKADSLKSF